MGILKNLIGTSLFTYLFMSIHNTDIMLISETHFTGESCLKLTVSTVYHSNHLAETARGGTVILIIKSSIKHQYSNQCGLTEYNSGVWLPLPT
jgi:hypothetical protein